MFIPRSVLQQKNKEKATADNNLNCMGEKKNVIHKKRLFVASCGREYLIKLLVMYTTHRPILSYISTKYRRDPSQKQNVPHLSEGRRVWAGNIMSHLMTKPAKWMCAERRLISALASAQTNQNLHCALSGS